MVGTEIGQRLLDRRVLFFHVLGEINLRVRVRDGHRLDSKRSFSLRFPVALEEEEEEEEENPTSDDETFLFEEEEAEEEDIEIREEKELKNVIDDVDATVKTLILRAHVSKFN